MNRSRMIRRTRLFGATVLALGLYACSDQANQPLAPDAAELAFASPLSQSALAVSISAQESVLPQLMALEDVVGAGIGIRADGTASIKVFLKSGDMAGIPASVSGVPVETIVTGEIFALNILPDMLT